jgi:hypothetical protein
MKGSLNYLRGCVHHAGTKRLFERLEPSREPLCVICRPWSDFHKHLIVLTGRHETRIGGAGEHQHHILQTCLAPLVLFRAELQHWGNGIFATTLSKPAKSELQRVSSRIHFFNVIRSSQYSNIKAVGSHRIPIVGALSHSGSAVWFRHPPRLAIGSSMAFCGRECAHENSVQRS